MNNTDLLLKKFNQMQNYSEVAVDSKKNFERFLKFKVLHLYNVGNSVLRKQLGSEKYHSLNATNHQSALDSRNEWILIWNPKIEFNSRVTDPRKARFTVTGISRDGEHLSYSVSISILSTSDRAFAKEIRATQRLAFEKNRKKEIEWAKSILKNAEIRERKLQKDSVKDILVESVF